MFSEYTILLVEDDKNMQEYMKQILADECRALYIANDGKEGLEKYKLHQPDLVITDLNMPKMNGIIMSKEIKKESCNQPIILLSAFGEIDELQEAINIGLNAFISKPLEKIDLLFSIIEKQFKQLKYIKEVNRIKEIEKEQEEKVSSLIGEILYDDHKYVNYEFLSTQWNKEQ